MAKILVVDDEEKICFAFEQFFKDKGHIPFIASSAEDALKIVAEKKPRIIFLDIRLPGKSGLWVLKEIKKIDTQSMVIMITAYGTMDTAIEAMREGAYEYITKPIDLDRVDALIKKMLRSKKIRFISQTENIEDGEETLIGKSRAIEDIYKMIGLLTTNDVPVLIEGESGVGKELIARAIHFKSERKDLPFVAINCGAMPENLLETELFGHEKGSFTGADALKIGKFEHAGHGTVFLDEIGDLQLPLQIKLLRVLQEKQLVRVGGLDMIPVKARVITATNKNLFEEVKNTRFRSDLYYRLQLITLKIPPLRERKEDIMDLVEHFIHKSNLELGKKITGIEKLSVDQLLEYNWPGNVRELENVIKRAAILSRGEVIELKHMDSLIFDKNKMEESFTGNGLEDAVKKIFKEKDGPAFDGSGQFYKNIIGAVEKILIKEALNECSNNQVKASGLLGMHRTTFRKKMDEYGMN